MQKDISNILALIFLSILLFIIVGSTFGSTNPTTDFLLSMIVSHLILDKNQWITKIFKNNYSKNRTEFEKNDDA